MPNANRSQVELIVGATQVPAPKGLADRMSCVPSDSSIAQLFSLLTELQAAQERGQGQGEAKD